MQYEQALIIGKRRRSDATLAPTLHVQERAREVCAVKPARNSGLDARDWEPVGEEIYKVVCAARLREGGALGGAGRVAAGVLHEQGLDAVGVGLQDGIGLHPEGG